MIIFCSIVGWLAGSAFWFGWSSGESAERSPIAYWVHSPALWFLFPVYMLGFHLGKRHTERELAPERMRQKLLEQAQLRVATPPWNITAYTSPSQGVGGSVGSVSNP